MPDLNEEILKLKGEGMSLRQIAAALGISHEAVRKRLMAVNEKNQVSTNPEYQKLTAPTIKKEKVSTGSKSRKSRTSEELGDTVNRVSTKETPSHTLTEGVNPLGTLTEQPTGSKKELSHRMCPEVDGLFEAIKEFLTLNGVELYRMQVGQEAYQVKHKSQIIRLYVHKE